MQIYAKKIIILSVVSSLLMTSCASKRDTGAMIGSILGGVTGIVLGKNKKDREKYGALGAVTGAIVGASIGDYLDEQDKVELRRKAIELANNNQQQTSWKSNHSGATAELVVVNDYYEDVYSEPTIIKEPKYEPIVVENSNLGKRVNSVSKTKKVKRKVVMHSKPKVKKIVHSKPKLKTITNSESKPKVAIYSKERKVLAQRKCKNVKVIVKLPNGNRKTESVKTCQDKNGIYGV